MFVGLGVVVVTEVGMAVAVTVVTCRRKNEASDLGIASSDGIVRVGNGLASDRGAYLCIAGSRERRSKCFDDARKFVAEDGSKGGIVPQGSGRVKSAVQYMRSLEVASWFSAQAMK